MATTGKHISEKVNLNTASKAELTKIPQVSESRAEAILHWRESHGPFKEWTDLDRIIGFSMALVEGLKEFATIEPQPA